MKAVLISTQPRWCGRIATGDKTDEIRKNAPQIAIPFKCYIYQTKTAWSYPILRALGFFDLLDKLEAGKGKIIGEFVCDKIEQIDAGNYDHLSRSSCVSLDEMWRYSRPKTIFDLKAWHISSLEIYDEPKALDEFFYACNKKEGTDCSVCRDHREYKCKSITRPPQSWCYVEVA